MSAGLKELKKDATASQEWLKNEICVITDDKYKLERKV
jgi:hypothetical protein